LKITKAQNRFLTSEKRGVIFQGGIGSGKTYIHCIRAVQRALQGRHFCIVSFSYPTLRDVCLVTLCGLLDDWAFVAGEHYIFNKSEMTFDFPSTSGKILLRSGDRPDSLRGLNLDDFGIDEAREWRDESIFNIMLGRLRRGEDGSWCITTTTKGYNWVHTLGLDSSIEVITQSTMDNPFLPKAYIDELKARYTSDFARQELYAEIVEFGAGIIKPEWFQYDPVPAEGKGIRFWDLAQKTGEHNDYSAGGKVIFRPDGTAQIADMIQDKVGWLELKELVMSTAERDGIEVEVHIEDAQQGYPLYEDLSRDPRMGAYVIKCEKPKGNKLNRAMAWASKLENGTIKLMRGAWNDNFIRECISFTADDSHQHDDMIDTVSGAWAANCGPSLSIGFL